MTKPLIPRPASIPPATSHPRAVGWLLLVAPPLILTVAYQAIALTRFSFPFSEVQAHSWVVGLWVAATILLTACTHRLFGRWADVSARLGALVTATGGYLLYLVYLASVIGNLGWGKTPSWQTTLSFLPETFHLSESVGLHWMAALAILIGPAVLLLALCQWKAAAIRAALEGPSFRWGWVVWAAFIILVLYVGQMVLLAPPQGSAFGDLSLDPVLRSIEPNDTLVPENAQAMAADIQDNLARRSLKPRKARVHNVILILVDALRADHLPVYGNPRPVTPYLDRLLRSVSYRKVDTALSNGLETASGVESLFSSREVSAYSPNAYTLSDCLMDQGFDVSMILSGDQVRWDHIEKHGKPYKLMVDGVEHPGPEGINDDEMLVQETRRLAPDDGGYHFFYYHLMSVHQLGHLGAAFLRYLPVTNIPLDKKRGDRLPDARLVPYRNMYDDRVLQADNVLHNILVELRSKGYLRDYVALLTADHGQLLGESGCFGHGTYAYTPALRIPMLFFGSSPLPPLKDDYGLQLDVAPSLLDLAGLDIPVSWQGHSLFCPTPKERMSCHRDAYYGTDEDGAVVYRGPDTLLKYTRNVALEGSQGGERVVDLLRDPDETINLLKRIDPDLLSEMRRRARESFVP